MIQKLSIIKIIRVIFCSIPGRWQRKEAALKEIIFCSLSYIYPQHPHLKQNWLVLWAFAVGNFPLAARQLVSDASTKGHWSDSTPWASSTCSLSDSARELFLTAGCLFGRQRERREGLNRNGLNCLSSQCFSLNTEGYLASRL